MGAKYCVLTDGAGCNVSTAFLTISDCSRVTTAGDSGSRSVDIALVHILKNFSSLPPTKLFGGSPAANKRMKIEYIERHEHSTTGMWADI